MPKGFLTDTN